MADDLSELRRRAGLVAARKSKNQQLAAQLAALPPQQLAAAIADALDQQFNRGLHRGLIELADAGTGQAILRLSPKRS